MVVFTGFALLCYNYSRDALLSIRHLNANHDWSLSMLTGLFCWDVGCGSMKWPERHLARIWGWKWAQGLFDLHGSGVRDTHVDSPGQHVTPPAEARYSYQHITVRLQYFIQRKYFYTSIMHCCAGASFTEEAWSPSTEFVGHSLTRKTSWLCIHWAWNTSEKLYTKRCRQRPR